MMVIDSEYTQNVKFARVRKPEIPLAKLLICHHFQHRRSSKREKGWWVCAFTLEPLLHFNGRARCRSSMREQFILLEMTTGALPFEKTLSQASILKALGCCEKVLQS